MRGISRSPQRLRAVPRILLNTVVIAAVALGLWLFFPVHLGGNAAVVIVKGHSMEPLLHFNDLAVTHRAGSYGKGDLVVFEVDDGDSRGMVIHRIVGGSADEGWKTQGDNNDWVDQWIVPNDFILGTYWFLIPGAGAPLTWVLMNPYPAAGVLALWSLALYLPFRRKRIAPELAAALLNAQRVSRHHVRNSGDARVLVFTSLATAVAGAVTVYAIMMRQWTPASWMTFVGVVVSGGLTLALASRLYNGRGISEPERSESILSEQLWDVAELPRVSPVTPAGSAAALRTIAEKYRMPVLRAIDAETGIHHFLVITVQKGSFTWQAASSSLASASHS